MSLEEPDFEPCDHGKVLELADGELAPETARGVRRHLDYCPGCRELYEHETDLNCYLVSLKSSEPRPCSVYRGVAMAIPTRSPIARLLWAALACASLLLALVYLELNGREPLMLVMSILVACWGFVSGSADVVHAILTAGGPVILLVLGIGAVLDILIVTAFVVVNRGRRARAA